MRSGRLSLTETRRFIKQHLTKQRKSMKEICAHSKRRLPNKVTLVRELAHPLLVLREGTSLLERRDQALLLQLKLQPLLRQRLPQLSQ